MRSARAPSVAQGPVTNLTDIQRGILALNQLTRPGGDALAETGALGDGGYSISRVKDTLPLHWEASN